MARCKVVGCIHAAWYDGGLCRPHRIRAARGQELDVGGPPPPPPPAKDPEPTATAA